MLCHFSLRPSCSRPEQAVTTKMSRIHAIMNGTAPLNSLQIHEKGHLLANSPSAASLSRRLSQVRAYQ